MAAIAPAFYDIPAFLPPPGKTHPHSELPPKGQTEKRELEVSRPQPQAALPRFQDPLPFPDTLVDTLTYTASFVDQAGYLAKYITKRFAELDKAYHALQAENAAEIKKLQDQTHLDQDTISRLQLENENLQGALRNALLKADDLQKTLEKERAAEKEHDSADHKTISDLQAKLNQALDDLAATKRDLVSALEREKALQTVVKDLQSKNAELKAALDTEKAHNTDLQNANTALKSQVIELNKDLAKAQKELARKTQDLEEAHQEETDMQKIINGLEAGQDGLRRDVQRWRRQYEELKKKYEHPEPERQIPRSKDNLAAVYHPRYEGRMYFLKGGEDVRIEVDSDSISRGVSYIGTNWGGLSSIGWKKVDAFLPISGGDLAYIFLDANYVKYDIWNNKAVEGPAPWATKWPALAAAGLTQIDTALPWIFHRPDDGRAAWFFQNDKAIRIDVGTGDVEAPIDSITTHFPSLAGAGVKNIDVAIFKPGKRGREAYFFVGDRYFLVDLVRNARLYPPSVVKQTWKSLRDAKFY